MRNPEGSRNKPRTAPARLCSRRSLVARTGRAGAPPSCALGWQLTRQLAEAEPCMGRASPAPMARARPKRDLVGPALVALLPPLSRARPRGHRVIYGLAGFVKVSVPGKAPRKSPNFLLLGKKQPGTSRREPSLLHRGWQEPGGNLASPKVMERGEKPNPESNPRASAATACTTMNPPSPTCTPLARGHRG